jgi:hypothetical protein
MDGCLDSERSSKLPSSNLVVFDLHGEYKELSYAKQLRIPGPDEVDTDDDSLLFLPYWLLNSKKFSHCSLTEVNSVHTTK